MMRMFGRVVGSTFLALSVTLASAQDAHADAFSKYTDLISMECMGENGVMQFLVEENTLSILDNDPMIFEIDGQVVKKNGTREQYIISLGFMEYFIDFEEVRAVANVFGIKQELYCY